MTQRRRKRNKKWLGKLVFVVLLVAAIIVCYFVWDGYFRDKDESETPSKDETVKVTEEQEDVKEKEEEKSDVQKEEIVQYEGENPNKKESITGAITYASVVNDNLMIRINIDQYLSGGGCKLVLKRGGTVIYEDRAAVINAASTATCEGFNAPVAGLGDGEIKIDVVVNSGDKSGVISGEVKL